MRRETAKNAWNWEERWEACYESEYWYEENMKSGKWDEVEDTLGWYEFEIVESVAYFEDEMLTKRNVIPDSSNDDYNRWKGFVKKNKKPKRW